MDKNSLVLGKYQYGRLLKNEKTKKRKNEKTQALVGESNIKLIYHSTYANYELNELFLMKKENGKYKINQMVYDDIHVIKLNERQQ